MMKGPFVVAPFISILVKVIIPWFITKLDTFSRWCDCPIVCLDTICDRLARFLALIFAYDGEAVGGFSFVNSGWPFTEVSIAMKSQPHDSPQSDESDASELSHISSLIDDAL